MSHLNKTNMKLSIIVTVYNKEKYLKKCLDSCLNQEKTTQGDYEIVVINDGSTDNSLTMLKEYADKHPFVKIVDQQNQGLSMARNNGVKECTGDYFWFVDSDDWISSSSVRLILENAKNDPDIITICAQTEGVKKVRNHINTSAKTGRDILLDRRWEHCAPFYVFKKYFWEQNNFSLFPGIYHEDSEFTPRMLTYVKTTRVIDEVLYNVFRDPLSITQVPRIKRSYDLLIVVDHLFQCREKQNDGAIKKVLDENISELLNNSINYINKFEKEERTRFSKELYKYRFAFKSLWNSALKYKVEYVLFSIMPMHCVGIYRLLKRLS